MVSVILVFPLQCHIHVYCLVCVMHTLKSGYCFLCIVCVICVFLLLIYPSNCPIYELFQVLHLSLYIPLEFMLVLVILSVRCWCIAFVARRAIFKLECLKRLVIFHICGLWYVNVTHFLGCCIVVVRSFCFCLLAISFFFRFWLCRGNPLFWAIASMIFHSCCLACFVIGSTSILFT